MSPTAGTCSNSFPAISGYCVVEQLYKGTRTVVYRAVETTSQQSVVIKLLQQAYPSFNELLQFRNQYTLVKDLDIPGIIRPYRLEVCGNSYALVMEDWGGISLSQYRREHSLTLLEILAIALKLAETLHDLHQAGIVHKDIKPANILIRPQSQQIKLIDFSIASRLPKESVDITNPNGLEGTLAYLAPEQSGRMNRGIDYRADFYALGVTLFELLTGQLPFPTVDPSELVHCHLAKQPAAVSDLAPSVPGVLAKIVNKLMAKNAEDRYQSALGLSHDLRICLEQLCETDKIENFAIATRDICDRFLISEKLYGRDAEVETLLAAFERVAQGKAELMLVAGFSGIGKTAVVNEVHKPITRQHGYFISGKFDQFNRSLPFSAFFQALRDLIGQLLSESDAQLQIWRTKICQALGSNAQVMIEVIPELEQIIGKQPAAPDLSGLAAQNRFNLLFQKFVRVFTTPAHPLVLFLDDLQWADTASLHLMKLLILEAEYLLVIAAYRHNEVFAAHPLMLTLDAITEKSAATVNTLTLQPLSQKSLAKLIANTLHCSTALAQPLTALVMQKTQGNPFFATQFLKGLYHDQLITFNSQLGYWQCDIAQIQTAALTADVVEFMAVQLQKLPQATQTLLKVAACVGNPFDLETLAIVSESPAAVVAANLWPALQSGFVLPTSQVYKFFQVESSEKNDLASDANPSYRFLHDRVQQAAYSLIADEQKQATHYHLGQLLLQKLPLETQGDRIFELVNQLNHGIALVTQLAERDQLAQLNLMACRKARSTTAYQAGRTFSSTGILLLGSQGWQRQYKMSLELHELAADLAALCGDAVAMEQLIETVLLQTQNLLEQVNVYRVRIQFNVSQAKFTAAIAIAQSFLQQLGITFPTAPTPADIQLAIAEIAELIGDRAVEDLLDLPMMSDQSKIAIVQIANSIIPAAAFSGSPLTPLLVALSVKLSVQSGNTAASAAAYATYGILTCNFLRDIETGVKFGQLALNLVAKLEAKAVQPEILPVVSLFTLHRKSHLRETLLPLQAGYIAALEVGNQEMAGHNAEAFCLHAFWVGQPLAPLEQSIKAYCQGLKQFNQLMAHQWCCIHWQTVLNLLKAGEQPTELSGKALQAAQFLPQMTAARDWYGLGCFHLAKLMLCYWFGEIELAHQHAVEFRRYFSAINGKVLEPIFYFYEALIALAQLSSVSENRLQLLQRVEENQIQLQQFWANYAPMNYQHKVNLIKAEKYRILGQKAEAIEQYEEAILAARENGYLQEEALANELAAKFYLAWDKEKVAAGYMQEAYYGYARWGAKAKAAELENRYPNLLRPILQSVTQSLSPFDSLATIAATNFSTPATVTGSHSTDTINSILDFATVLRASQSLSRTMQLDNLLHQLAQIILQNSGGDRCALILPNQEGVWCVEAIATPETTDLCSEPLENNPNLPVKLIQYVKNTQEMVVIDDFKTDLPIIDAYLQQQQPQSILCLPILNQGKLLGILYLKNQSVRGAFTKNHILVLNFLCTQAAISLENARLYQASQTYARQLEQSLEKLRVSETRFQKLADNVPGLIYQIRIKTDGSASMPYVSSGCQSLYEIAAEDLMSGKCSLRDFEHPDDQAGVLQAVAASAKNLTPFRHEWRIITPRGAVKWVKAASQPERKADGELVWDGILIDITDRKQIEAEQKRLLDILESTSDLVGTAAPDGKSLYLNRTWRNLLELGEQEELSQTNISQFHPDWALEIVVNQALPEARRAGLWIGETAILDKAGSEIPVSQVILAHKSNHGEVEYFSTIIRDISNVKAAEAALRVSEKNLRAIFDNSNSAIFVHDVDGTLLDVNNRMLEMYQVESREQALTLSALDYSGPDNPFDQVPLLWDRALAGEMVRFEWKSHRPGDRFVFDTEIVLNKITLDNKEVIIASIQDISERQAALRERQRAEAAVLQKSQELEQALANLQNAQLQIVQNEKMASLGNLVAGVAHEINNPIGFLNGSILNAKDYVQDLFDHLELYQQHHADAADPVQAHADAIDLEFLSQDLPKLMESMQSATDRIKSISTSLRTFSRADTDSKVSTNLHEGLDSTLLILKYRLKANQNRPAIQVVQDYAELPKVECFPGQLNQVFMNILANAIDVFDEAAEQSTYATLEANPQIITIQTAVRAEQNAVEIRICDNGKGMSAAVQARVFDHLFTTKGVGKGTGLGLAIARQIVTETHAGSLEVQSEIGQGSAFIIRLPMSD